eukprot:SAG31_NODE_1808_length_7230_cov_32.785835_7_plen_468_part_00
MAALSLLLALRQPAAGAAFGPGRETVSFNFGWRFTSGDPPGIPPACASADFENLTTDCAGTFYAPLHSPADCMKACCPGSGYHPNCSVWSWCDAKDPAHWKENVTCGCYLGDMKTTSCPGKPSKIKWSGGRRTAPWPERSQSAYADPDYDDSQWQLVDAPHDFVIANEFSPAAADGGQHGYLERERPGHYRKRFTIPADWRRAEDVMVWLRFNGVFHITQAWLDGKSLALGPGSRSGYTAFTAALPEQMDPDEHVLALRVDASFGSGHWYEGGGIFRDCFIVAARKTHIAEDGLFAPTNADRVMARAEIVNEGAKTVTVLAKGSASTKGNAKNGSTFFGAVAKKPTTRASGPPASMNAAGEIAASPEKLSLIVFEEVDNIFDGADDGFFPALAKLAETTRRPIVLTANVHLPPQAQAALSRPGLAALQCEFKSPKPAEVARLLRVRLAIELLLRDDSDSLLHPPCIL